MRKANSLMIAAVPKISSKTVCTASPPFFLFLVGFCGIAPHSKTEEND